MTESDNEKRPTKGPGKKREREWDAALNPKERQGNGGLGTTVGQKKPADHGGGDEQEYSELS